jgi:hypothetical protein
MRTRNWDWRSSWTCAGCRSSATGRGSSSSIRGTSWSTRCATHEPETVYIGRALRAIKRFAKVHDVAFWIVAHPTKPFEGKVRMPRLLDISGSANWANKADFGLSYHAARATTPTCA